LAPPRKCFHQAGILQTMHHLECLPQKSRHAMGCS
jgi:hypothetical protein